MRRSLVEIYIHLVWGTWDRHACVTPDIEDAVYSAIVAKCSEHECVALAIGGTPDHVHLLIRTNAMPRIADLVRDAKGSSSHLVTKTVKPTAFFRWQGGYGAFSVDVRSVTNVIRYIQNQKTHHAERTESQYLEYYLTAPDPKPSDESENQPPPYPAQAGFV